MSLIIAWPPATVRRQLWPIRLGRTMPSFPGNDQWHVIFRNLDDLSWSSESRLHSRPAHLLAHSQVGHDLLAAAQDGGVLVRLLETLNVHSHARAGNAPAAEHLNSLVCDEGASTRGLVLQQCDGAPEFLRLFLVWHRVHLVRHQLQQRMRTLDHSGHPCKFLPQDRLLNEGLAESLALRRPLEAICYRETASRQKLRHNHPSLMVEVVHDARKAVALDPLVEETHKVLHGHLHIVEDDQSGTGTTRVCGLNGLCLHT